MSKPKKRPKKYRIIKIGKFHVFPAEQTSIKPRTLTKILKIARIYYTIQQYKAKLEDSPLFLKRT